MTNRQWLESLGDENFVKEVFSMIGCSHCVNGPAYCYKQSSLAQCEQKQIEWLQSEHEENKVNA